jgi:uncharacterized protein
LGAAPSIKYTLIGLGLAGVIYLADVLVWIAVHDLGVHPNYANSVTGVNVSVAIRLVYHLYQGAIGVVTIIPFGLIVTWWYARTGKLWPILVAHAAIDFMGLLQFVD